MIAVCAMLALHSEALGSMTFRLLTEEEANLRI
jgi:hypothetical protein